MRPMKEIYGEIYKEIAEMSPDEKKATAAMIDKAKRGDFDFSYNPDDPTCMAYRRAIKAKAKKELEQALADLEEWE